MCSIEARWQRWREDRSKKRDVDAVDVSASLFIIVYFLFYCDIIFSEFSDICIRYVICNSKLVAKVIIELDDSSHDTQKRTERDLFVDTVLTTAGYKVIHLRGINEALLEDEIKKAIEDVGEELESVPAATPIAEPESTQTAPVAEKPESTLSGLTLERKPSVVYYENFEN